MPRDESLSTERHRKIVVEGAGDELGTTQSGQRLEYVHGE